MQHTSSAMAGWIKNATLDVKKAEAYAAALDDLIPAARKPHRRKARKRAIYLAGRGEFGSAKFYALRLFASPEQLLAMEMLIFGEEIHPYHPDPMRKHWR